MSEKIIVLKNVYAGYDGTDVIEDVNLEVEKNDFLGIIGPNGGGKTTVLKLIAGVMKPSKGDVLVFGKNPAQFNREERGKIGYVRQETVFDASFPISVLDTVVMGLFGGMGPGARVTKKHLDIARQALEKTGMQGFEDRHIGALSGGQKQRVFISRGLVNSPELLILDEPTTGVDAHNQAAFYEMLAELKKGLNLTIIMVSHDISMIADEVNKISCVNHSIHVHGEPEGVLSDEKTCEVCGIDPKYVFDRKHAHKLGGHEHE
jgi:zinc transport system ATP-binding protein